MLSRRGNEEDSLVVESSPSAHTGPTATTTTAAAVAGAISYYKSKKLQKGQS